MRGIIATLNRTQTHWAFDGDRFWDYVRDGILHTMEINHDVNFNNIVTIQVNGCTKYIYPGEELRSQMAARFGQHKQTDRNIH